MKPVFVTTRDQAERWGEPGVVAIVEVDRAEHPGKVLVYSNDRLAYQDFEPHEARAFAYALLSAADAARFGTKEA